ncbi:unnamed protein product [Angiostrongylus costaricensis]|uniref:tRNA:m(4)X modification enzyme n=1 Tax=Angiostrongylus costaricensis TaxID=334426 RepID=A0A158PFL2_ANGCS|nr:unnamed protein product [Angiostrongylus costaricensis]
MEKRREDREGKSTVLEVADIFVGLGEGVLSFFKAYLEKNSESRASMSTIVDCCQMKKSDVNVNIKRCTSITVPTENDWLLQRQGSEHYKTWDEFSRLQCSSSRTSLLDVEGVDAARSDENLVITCVSLCYHHFAEQKRELAGARRVVNVGCFVLVNPSCEKSCFFLSLCRWFALNQIFTLLWSFMSFLLITTDEGNR